MTDERLILCIRIALWQDRMASDAYRGDERSRHRHLDELRTKLAALPPDEPVHIHHQTLDLSKLNIVTSPHDEAMAAKEKAEAEARKDDRAKMAWESWLAAADPNAMKRDWSELVGYEKAGWRAVAAALDEDRE